MRNNDVTYLSIEKAFSFFSSKETDFKVQCFFVKHDGYIGSLGCLSSAMR